ncbi:MAG: hypothetical protein IT559_04565 [Alphaproteobacteria bacterium]|nr:hypothetical protein [Alphaproteobacteria bacterium]
MTRLTPLTLLILLFAIAALLIVLTAPANAASCYSKAEAEAEQAIRIHSELMVIGLNCQHMGARDGMNLYQQYRQFTADHGKLLAGYEQTLMDFFQRNGEAKPEASLNTLRTNVANKISNDVAAMRPDIFCSRYAPRIIKASKMSGADVRKWASTVYPSHPVSRPFCAGG